MKRAAFAAVVFAPFAAVLAQGTAPPPAAAPAGGEAIRGSYLFGNQRFHDDPEVLWSGFLSGLRGFEHFSAPIGNPIYFETPFNTTEVRALFLHHTFPDNSQLQGGDVDIAAAQVRVALTERLGLIATKDGYSWLDAEVLEEEEGWNEIAGGLKYAFWVDREADVVVTGGARFLFPAGDEDVLQQGAAEVSPFISAAKGWDRLHLIGSLTDRIPWDSDRGNNVLMWDLHLDYEIAPQTLPGFTPTIEVHGLHYLSDGERTPLRVGGYDYTNLGSTDVAGTTMITMDLGARWKFTPNFSIGAAYGLPLTNRNVDIFNDRITIDAILSW